MLRERPERPPTEKTANAVIEGDVLDVLRSLPDDRRFDVIIADPPYNIGKDFGNNRDLMPLPAYVEWTREWIAECFARLACGGVLYEYQARSRSGAASAKSRLTSWGAGVSY